MTASNRPSIYSMAGTLVLATMLAFTGCSKSPLEPNPEPNQPQVLGRAGVFTGDAQGSPIAMATEQVISAEQGGRLELFDVILDVPPGALDVDTVYSISIPDISIFYNEFGADGLVFDKPVTVTMSYRDADLSNVVESSIRIGWWNEKDQQWVDMECQLDRANKVVTGELYHFSAYALVSD